MGEIFVQEKAREAMASTGERFTTAESGQIEIEHIHRYFLARHLCRGQDVLDVASGEGYGSALLAQVARSVIGVDTAADAVAHAGHNYNKPNLLYRVGDACELPVGDGVVDRVVSFETVEHFYDHETFLREIKRALRPDGMLIMSTPERDIYSPLGQAPNPFHVHELTRREFYALIGRHFRHVRYLSQRPMLGSAIIYDEQHLHDQLPVVFENRGENRVEASVGLPRATYLICIASDDALPALPESLYIHASNVSQLLAKQDRLNLLDRVLDENKTLHADNVQLRRDRRDSYYTNQRNWDLSVNRQEERQRIDDQRAEITRLRYDIALERQQFQRELERLSQEIAQREQIIAHNHAAAQHEMQRRDAQITALHGQAAELHKHYFAEVQRLRRRSLRDELRKRVGRKKRLGRITRTLRASPLFDAAWYLANNPDVAASRQDPYVHYALAGADDGRDPGPAFSTVYYLRIYPDVIASDYNPLEHYELFGRAEGRLTRPAPQAAIASPPESPPDAVASAPVEPTPDGAAADAPSGGSPRIPPPGPHIVFLSGEHKIAGHIYRVLRYAEAAREIGCSTTVLTIDEAGELPRIIEAADLVFIWRAEWNRAVDRVVDWTRAANIPILFDVDDLMFDPELARTDIIDGIRSQELTELEVSSHYIRIQQTLYASNFCSSPTQFLTGQMRRWGGRHKGWAKPSFVMPNGFDETTWRTSRRAARARLCAPPDNILRIGYAGGSRTHQKDFAAIVEAVVRVLREGENRRLVLFKVGRFQCLEVAEFPALHELSDQIEWRELVPLADLPWEMARFDINLAPLEVGNPFCEAKSELKFFEAALVGVPTIASPTVTFRGAIRDGVTGLLADTEACWYEAITRLLQDAGLRQRVATAAYHDVLWHYGPEGRREVLQSVLEQILYPGTRAARAFEFDINRALRPPFPVPTVPESDVIVEFDTLAEAEVTIVIPLYNYARFVTDALESVREQTLGRIDLVVIDDGSTDDSLAVARTWIEANEQRFNRVVLRRNRRNSGLALTRNAGFAAAETRFVLPLDADNKLNAHCAERCLAVIKETGAAFVYPSLKKFGNSFDLFSHEPYAAVNFAAGNFVDATALIRLSAWAAVGGYEHLEAGWEDYDFWCKLAERGMFGHHLDEVLALYRVHRSSMLHTTTDDPENKAKLIAIMQDRHPWVFQNMGLEDEDK